MCVHMLGHMSQGSAAILYWLVAMCGHEPHESLASTSGPVTPPLGIGCKNEAGPSCALVLQVLARLRFWMCLLAARQVSTHFVTEGMLAPWPSHDMSRQPGLVQHIAEGSPDDACTPSGVPQMLHVACVFVRHQSAA